MLSLADAELCARDPALPGLAAVLDAGALARAAGLGELRATYLRYKPGTSCVVGLMPERGGLGAFAAMTYTPARYSDVRARSEWQSGPHSVLFLDDICTALVPLSRDRNLKAARMLGSAERRRRFLKRIGLEGAELSLLRYKPGRRLVMRAVTPAGEVAVVKAHGAREFKNAVAGATHGEGIGVARVLAVSKRKRSIATRWIEGLQLDPVRADPDAFRATGSELARLHLATARPSSLAGHLYPYVDADAVASLLPDLAGTATDTAARIAAALARLAPCPCIVHGDFSADQVVLRDGQPSLIDWDRIAVADPARDLGSFLARLDADVIEGTLHAEAARAAETAFRDGYSARAGRVLPGIEAYRAAALLALAPQAFRGRHSDWPGQIAAMIARADGLVASGRTRPAEESAGLADALDAKTIAPKLADALGWDVSCSGVHLLRHKPGRRALIRYDLGTGQTVLGKLRAKGPDRRTPRLHRALRDAGLDGRAPHLVGVPDAMGEIDEPAIWLQRMVPGPVLTDLIEGGGATETVRRTGRALGMLHDIDVTCDRNWTISDELDVLDRALSGAATARPDLANRIDAIRAATTQALQALPESEATGIHRDFYPDQVLIDGEAVWLVDLDLYARGDPVVDLGNFLAHLTEQGLRSHADAGRYRAEARAFVTGYEEVRGGTDRNRLAVLHWSSLARHIGISGRIAGRRHTTDALVSMCATGPSGALFRAVLPDCRSPAA